MNEHATIEKLQGMKLYGMAGAFKAAVETGADRSMSVTDLLAQLVDAEWEDKHHRRTDRLARAARFRAVSTVSDIDWLANRNLDKSLVMRLADCRFITEKKTVIVTGSTGVGKSFLAQALGTKTCEMGFATAYWNCAKLFPLLKEQRREGSYARMILKLAKTALLILDDFGLSRLDVDDRLSLLEIIEDRYGKGATIVTSQIPVTSWHEIIGDQTIADAICDRLVHRAIRIEMTGQSMRTRDPQELALAKERVADV